MSTIPEKLPRASSLAFLLKNPGKWHVLASKPIDSASAPEGYYVTWEYYVKSREDIIDAADAWKVFCPQRRVGNTLEWLGIALSEPPARKSRQPAKLRFSA